MPCQERWRERQNFRLRSRAIDRYGQPRSSLGKAEKHAWTRESCASQVEMTGSAAIDRNGTVFLSQKKGRRRLFQSASKQAREPASEQMSKPRWDFLVPLQRVHCACCKAQSFALILKQPIGMATCPHYMVLALGTAHAHPRQLGVEHNKLAVASCERGWRCNLYDQTSRHQHMQRVPSAFELNLASHGAFKTSQGKDS